MRVVFDGSTEELAALLAALRAGAGLSYAPPLPLPVLTAPAASKPQANNDDDDDSDDDDDDDIEKRTDAEARRRLDEAIRAAANHGDALLAVFSAYRGCEITAAVAFERVRAVRGASVGSLDHAIKMLVYAQKLTRVAKGVFVLR